MGLLQFKKLVIHLDACVQAMRRGKSVVRFLRTTAIPTKIAIPLG